MEPIQHHNLLIRFEKGYGRPELKDGTLTVYTHYDDYNYYQKADICLSDTIVLVGMLSVSGDFNYKPNYYVLDYGVWNWRTGFDMSVIKNLEKVGHKILPKKEKHRINFDFGRSKLGKEKLQVFLNLLNEKFSVIDNEATVRLRNWDQTQEIILYNSKTKMSLLCSTELLEDVIDTAYEFGFKKEIDAIEEQKMKALFEAVEIDVDLKDYFKKKK